jgi:MFS family permease
VALFGIFAGVLTDRTPGKKLMIFGQTINILAIATLIVLLNYNLVAFWNIAIIALIVGTGWTLDFPNRRSLVMHILGQRNLSNAIIMDSIAYTLSVMVGPLYAGLLLTINSITTMGIVLCLYIGGLFILQFVKISNVQINKTTNSAFEMLKEGFSQVFTNRLLLGVFIITVVSNLLFFPSRAMIPVFARDVLEVGTVLFGVLGSASGVGALIGSILLASISERKSPARLFAYGVMFAMAMVCIFSLSRFYPLSVLLLFLSGFGIAGFATMQFTLILKGSSENVRGRAIGIVMMAMGVQPFGMLLVGATSEILGVTTAVGINSALGLLVLLFVVLKYKIFRQATSF